MGVSGRDPRGDTAELHLGLHIFNYCGLTITVLAKDFGSATGDSTAVMNDGFRVAPNLKTAAPAPSAETADGRGQSGNVLGD